MSDPFDDAEINPFADPAVTSASSAAPVEVYNPFDTPDHLAGTYVPPGASDAPPGHSDDVFGDDDVTPKAQKKKKKKKKSEDDDEPWNEPLNPSAVAAGSSRGHDDIAIREAALKRREAELLERERALEEKLAEARRQGMQPYNWPSSCYPILYHSIKEEIPAKSQKLVKYFYAQVGFAWVCLFWNWVTVVGRWINSDGGTIGQATLASVYLVVGVPGAWQMWYRGLYFANRDDSSTKWISFFVNFSLHLLFSVIMAIGVSETGAAGFVTMIFLFANNYTLTGIFAFVAASLWSLNVATGVYLLKKAHAQWKGDGGEQKAKTEVARAAVESQV